MKNKIINLFGKNDLSNKEVKYSALLEQFILPFEEDFRDFEYYEDIFEFAIIAWNFGNTKSIMDEDQVNQTLSFGKDEKNYDLLVKLIDNKVSNFKEYNRFITDFELEELNGKPNLTVVTQLEEDYVAEMFENEKNEFNIDPDEYQQNYINRFAIVLKPQQPFIDWVNNWNPTSDFLLELNESNVYLIGEDVIHLDEWIHKKFDILFSTELGYWNQNKKDWPQKRSFKMFNQWFKIEISKSIYDLEDRPVKKYN